MAEILASTNKKSYTHNLLSMATVPFYQIAILQAFNEVSKAENIAAEAKCSGLTFALRRAWCYVEVIGFWVNIGQLMLYLLGQMKIGYGLYQALVALWSMITCSKDDKIQPDDDTLELQHRDNMKRIVAFTQDAINKLQEETDPWLTLCKFLRKHKEIVASISGMNSQELQGILSSADKNREEHLSSDQIVFKKQKHREKVRRLVSKILQEDLTEESAEVS